ncbi:CRISPR/Cas system-associated endonuclease Cas1 [Thermodesulfovibrio aggregans]|uniref:CRISPR/Cas system-associated endonuclease Cas1 n=1 Tax=Thermodesulfovibrio aggregans TaxID=86166 RepID=A0A0U9HYW8_9BACT|nr:CRISPR-associated endonuclease Cas1 [Thermodesulfovibrio aggregans]GAQ95557.1 CRISPR/Cas system-associated endonuclease Cas1 [Thermodesulfovibrio aggregans]
MQENYLKKRTLYLIERGNGTSVRRDGPSLLIERRNCAPVRIPVNLVDKVVIYGNVELDSFSLTLFSAYRVPVLIIGRHDGVSIVLPYNNDAKTNSKIQKLMLASPKIVNSYKDWVLKTRGENQRKILNKLFPNMSITIEGEENYEKMIGRIKPSDFLWSLIKEIMANLLIITILSRLLNAKLDPHLGILNQNCNYGLVFDIYFIHEPIAEYLAFQFFYADSFNIDFAKNPEINGEQLQRIIELFEKKKEEIEYQLNKTIAEIFHLMRQITP